MFRDGKGKLLHFVSMVGKIAHCTPDDLLDVAEEGLFELVDGKLVEKQMSSPAGRTAALLAQRLISHLERTRAGELMVGATFRCFPNDPDRVRRPDLPFVAALNAARLPPEGHIPFAPDLVIEVTARTPRK